MNAIKIDFDKKFEGAETAREQYSKINNSRKYFNFPQSPNNNNIKSLNLGNVNPRSLSKNTPKGNSSDKSTVNNIKKKHKQNSTNNLNNSNINNKNKSVKNLELKEKDINNFKEFKIKETNNDLLFNKEIFNNKIKSILFKNINNNINNNLLLKTKKKGILNNIDNFNLKKININEINKIDISSIKDIKNKPMIVKLDPKRSSSCLNGKKINEKIKKVNNKKKNNSSKLIDEEETKRIKTPTKKIFIESDRSRMKESLSEIINKNFMEIKGNTTTKIKNSIKPNNLKLVPEENHFKAVLYSQEIKKLHMSLS